MTVNTALIQRLKTGSIKNVLLFGDSFEKQTAPYVIVKPIAGGDRKLYQIIVHVKLGLHDNLEKYILQELTDLFSKPLSVEESTITVRSTGAWFGPYVDQGDNTLAMCRDFFVPIII